MLRELLEKLEGQHGIPQDQGKGVIDTVVQHIKEKFPMVGNMLDSVMGSQASSTSTNTSNTVNTSSEGESTLQKLEDLAKSKLGGLFGG